MELKRRKRRKRRKRATPQTHSGGSHVNLKRGEGSSAMGPCFAVIADPALMKRVMSTNLKNYSKAGGHFHTGPLSQLN